ncbi:hypothetical protein BMS3Bbin15_00335 [archaeon BMS3Bbin15]|nr:hypothetical protein BMS3Bbin15_00335 [archaeon BMS3Bbin15]
MRGIALILLIILLPGIHAQEIYSEQHNLTYFLNNAVKVEENINLVLMPFSVKNPLYYPLPEDSSNITIEAPKSVRYTINFDRKFIIFDMSQVPVNHIDVEINYTRLNSIFERNGVESYSGLAFRKYLPWVTYSVNVKFVIPPAYDFGSISPQARVFTTGNSKAIEYNANIRFNFSTITDGIPVNITYANYRKLAGETITIAKARQSGALFAFKDANSSLENAHSYNLNVSNQILLYREADGELYSYFREINWAENLMSSGDYYPAYLHAGKALSLLDDVSIKSRDVSRKVSISVQRTLEREILKVSNMSSREKKYELNTTVTLPGTTSSPEGKSSAASYILIFSVLFGVIVAVYLISKPRPVNVGKTSRMRDFRVISDLKRKKFSGFDRKVKTVRERAELASEIRKLSKLRGKYESGIENLRKKLALNEIDEEQFTNDREELDREIEAIDREIVILKKKLAEIRKRKMP